MKIKKCLSLFLSFVFVSTTAFGAGKSSTYVTFEAYYKEITNPDRTINFKKLERILRQDSEVRGNFTVLLKLLQGTKGPRAQLLFFEKDGQRYPRLQIGDANQSLFIDIHGEQERFLRIGNAYYSVEEVRTPVLFLKKYFASNPREEKRLEADLLKQPLNITYEMWKILSPEQRALTMAGLRALLYDAILVKEAFGRGKEISRSFWFESLFTKAFADRYAEGAPEEGAAQQRRCIVAGFKSEYLGSVCSTEKAVGVPSGCTSGQFPCNPAVFGRNPQGGLFCLNRSDRPYFNQATKNCHEKESPIGTPTEIRRFLDSLLKSKGAEASAFLREDGKVVSQAKFNELKEQILGPFISEIDSAIALCEGDGHSDSNQGTACEALRDRKLKFQTYVNGLQVHVDTNTTVMCPTEEPRTPPPPAAGSAGCIPQAGAGTGSAGGATAGGTGGCGAAAGSAAGGAAGSAGQVGSAQPGCGAQIPGGGSPYAGSNTTGGSGSNDDKSSPGFFGGLWSGIGSAASGIWNWMKRNQSLLLGLGLTFGVGYLVYQLVRPPKKKSSPTPAQDPVAPPVSAPVITPTTTPPPVTPSVR